MSIWSDIHRRSTGNRLRSEDIIYKEMKYGPAIQVEIIVHNIYRGVEYYVLNHGWWPEAYVICDNTFLKRHYDHDNNCLNCISINRNISRFGSCTDGGILSDSSGKKRFAIGWKYDQKDDYCTFKGNLQGHKYTSEEMIADCKLFIDQYLSIKKRDECFIASHPADVGINTSGQQGILPFEV